MQKSKDSLSDEEYNSYIECLKEDPPISFDEMMKLIKKNFKRKKINFSLIAGLDSLKKLLKIKRTN